MLPDRPVEVADTGHALTEHRENLAVTFAQLVSGAGGISRAELVSIEMTKRMDVKHIERYHKALMTAWTASEPKAGIVVSMREQWYTTPVDWELWAIAKAKRPTVAWWWGARRDMDAAGAYCYVCDAAIHRYDVSRGLTMRGRLIVMTHRYGHALLAETVVTTEPRETDS